MKNTKIILTLCVIAGTILLSSCNCTEQKCRDQFGMIKPDECPPVPPPSPCNGTSITPLDKSEAKAWIANVASSSSELRQGFNVNQCNLMEFTKLEFEGYYIILGKKPSGQYVIIAKGIKSGGEEVYYDVTGNDPDGPICPPSSRCS